MTLFWFLIIVYLSLLNQFDNGFLSLAHLKFSHLDFLRSHVAQLVESFHSHCLPIMLVYSLKTTKSCIDNFCRFFLLEKPLLSLPCQEHWLCTTHSSRILLKMTFSCEKLWFRFYLCRGILEFFASLFSLLSPIHQWF